MLYFYSLEVIYRFFYIIISFVFCIIISFLNIETLLLVETYPFLQFSSKKFIVTQTTDLIDVIWILVFSTSFLTVFPFFFYQIIQFSKNSWYDYQINLSLRLFIYPLIIYLFLLLICYYILLPTLLEFLSQWETKKPASILNVEIEFRILNYIQWILTFRYIFNFFFYLISFFTLLTYFSTNLKVIYKSTKFYRKLFSFLSISFFFLLAPPDISIQLFIIFITFTFYEVIFLFICYKTYNTIFIKWN